MTMDSDIQYAIFTELCELHELGVESEERHALERLVSSEDFWKTYVAPMLDRICEDAGVLL